MYKGKGKVSARIMALVLAAGMSVSGLPVTALAAENADAQAQQEAAATQETVAQEEIVEEAVDVQETAEEEEAVAEQEAAEEEEAVDEQETVEEEEAVAEQETVEEEEAVAEQEAAEEEEAVAEQESAEEEEASEEESEEVQKEEVQAEDASVTEEESIPAIVTVESSEVKNAGTVPENGWYENDGQKYYYRDGEPVCDEVILVESDGAYYGFDYEGIMYTDTAFGAYFEEYDGNYHEFRAKEDGKLIVNDWYEEDIYKYYYGECGVAPEGVCEVDGTLYYFYSGGQLGSNRCVLFGDCLYEVDENGVATQITQDGWYTDPGPSGNKYYLIDGEAVNSAVIEIDGKYYGFDYEGALYIDILFDCPDEYFENWYYYRAKEDGSLYVNEWVVEEPGEYDEGGEYYYFDDGKARPGIQIVDGKQYAFTATGMKMTNTVYTDDDGVKYTVDSEGIATIIDNIKNGWNQIGGKWYYYEDGKFLEYQVRKIGDYYYGFADEGEMYDGVFFTIYSYGGEVRRAYYAQEGGHLLTNKWKCVSDRGSWYYFGSDAAAVTGWQTINGKKYYFSWNGRMADDYQYIDPNMYYFNDNGTMLTGWQKIDGKWHYFSASGPELYGWQKISGKWYYLNDYGEMQTGWQEINGKWYYFAAGGAMQTGWQKINGGWFYFNSNGAMLTGWQKISGKWYYFAGGGTMQTGWQKINNKWYYFAAGGAMQTGWQKINGRWFYLNSNGAMLTGWQRIGGKWYYFAPGGSMQTGWQKINNKWYYFAAGGAMQTGWQKINGSWYYLNSNGAMLTGWQQIGSKWYYFNDGGKMVTGTQVIGGKTYTFNSNGALQ